MPAAMQYDFGDGSKPLTEYDVMSQFQQAGYPVTGVSADGLNLIAQDPAGPKGQPGQQYYVPIHKALAKIGAQVKATTPIGSQNDTIEPLLSGMVSAMPSDDNLKKAYIEHTLKSRGIENPTVIGQGSDWHVYDPTNQQWAQLAKEGDWSHPDLAGAAELGFALPHMLGAAAGGAAGALAGSGVASIPAAAAGGATGSALGNAAEEAAMYGLDPDYRAAIAEMRQKNPNLASEYGTDILKTAGLDAAGEAVGAPIGKWIGKVTAPAARVISEGLQGAGDLISKLAGKVAGSPTATNVATDLVNNLPGVGTVGQVAGLMQGPAAAPAFVAKMPRYAAMAADSEVGGPLLQGSEEAIAKANQWANRMLGSGESAESVLGNMVGNRSAAARYAADPGELAAEGDARDAGREWAQGVLGPDALSEEELSHFGNAMGDDYRASRIDSLLGSEELPENWGHQVGRVADKIGAAGKLAQGVADTTTRAQLRALQGAAKAAGYAGRATPPIDRAARWATLPWAVRYGLIPLGEQEYDEMTNPP